MADLVVVGDTVEAALAAIFARRRGAAVVLCPRPRAIAAGPVTFELLRPSAEEVLSSRFSAEEGLLRACAAEGHPYRTLFPEGDGRVDALALLSQARLASEAFRNLLVTWGLPFEGEVHEPRLGLTEVGTVVAAGLSPADAAVFKRTGLPDRAEVVALAHDPSFPARLVAASLAARIPGIAGSPREIDLGLPLAQSPLEAAAAMPWERLAGALADGDGTLLMAPRRLGKAALPDRFRELLPVHGPSAAGVRLQSAVAEAISGLGISVHDGAPVAVDGSGERPVLCVASAGGGTERLAADRVIVASGKFARGGLVSSPRIACPLLPVPVGLPGRDEERIDGERHFDRRVLGRHDAFRIGVRVDGTLRPLGEDGRPWHLRVHAAGTLLGGADAVAEGSGLCLLTAWLAAHRALEAA